ncbi:MAG: hypothetical protein GC159_18525 [Phycisphaera sp.]|nr:hypothetical protein [Phycisphaera sp.]
MLRSFEICVGVLMIGLVGAGSLRAAEPTWAEPMRQAHRKFNGTPMYVAKFGDSITYSRAFWTPLGWSDPTPYIPNDDLPKSPRGRLWKQAIQGVNDTDACGSGWTVDRLLPAAMLALKSHKPEVALIMIGTNDISGGKLPDTYADQLERIITACLDQGCVPIVSTIPPRRDRAEAVAEANRVIKSLARRYHIPLVDFHAEILRLRSDDWDGTLISEDGVHPTGGKTQDYSDENLRSCGYALRTWLNFMAVREVYFRVIAPKEAK